MLHCAAKKKSKKEKKFVLFEKQKPDSVLYQLGLQFLSSKMGMIVIIIP